jgi:hypothetical protein
MASPSDQFSSTGLSAEAWAAVFAGATATATVALVVVTAFLVVLGRRQIVAIRHEAKQERTLVFCHRYDTEIVLDQALRRLGEARAAGAIDNNWSNKSDATSVLNYLDALAVGIAQDLYIEQLARDHMDAIVVHHVEQYLGEVASNLGLRKEDYAFLLNLADRWSSVPNLRRKLDIKMGSTREDSNDEGWSEVITHAAAL